MPKYKIELDSHCTLVIMASCLDDAIDIATTLYTSINPKFMNDEDFKIEEIKENGI